MATPTKRQTALAQMLKVRRVRRAGRTRDYAAADLPAGTRFLAAAELSKRRRAAGAARRAGQAATKAAPGVVEYAREHAPARPHLSDLTPRGFADYARHSATKVPAALLLFMIVAGIRAMRRGALPDAREAAGLLIAALVVAVAASFVPELVVAFLAGLLIVVALDATPAIERASAWLVDTLGGRATVSQPSPVTRPGLRAVG